MLEHCLGLGPGKPPLTDLRAMWKEYEAWEASARVDLKAIWREYEAWEATQRTNARAKVA